MTPDLSPGTPLHSALEIIRKAIADVLSQAFSSQWTVDPKPGDGSPTAAGASQNFAFSVSGTLQGTAVLEVGNTAALVLAQKFLAEPAGQSTELSNEHKEALVELFRQVAGRAETALKSAFGDLKVQVSAAEGPSAAGITVVLLASEAGSGGHELTLHVGEELMSSLATQPTSTAAAAESTLETNGEGEPSENNLDLLLGVDLSLTLRFGQRILTLREILDLTSGSVIELDRQVQEPADLLLGDKLIARGEVVIVDGNYGLRVTEVVDPRQRMSAI
jgi:flagellar motor switch protein FliN